MSRLIIISNRLPVALKKTAEGKWAYSVASGGLVTALNGLREQMEFYWVGWAGFEVTYEEREEISRDLMEKYSAIPVFLPEQLSEFYYNGFSNSFLWPLLHYLPGETVFKENHWEAYLKANIIFSNALESLKLSDNDVIWIHDYHLMMLPRLIRSKFGSKIKIGFFLHTPFPSSEIFKVLPVRKEILLGLLDSDLIGFHSYDYTRHFKSSCAKLLSVVEGPTGLIWQGKFVKVEAIPIGIDPEVFTKGLRDLAVRQRIEELKEKLAGRRLILGVDRLDYIKGIPNKLAAFQRFLEKYPDQRNEVVMIQIAVPSRADVLEYAKLQKLVYEMAGNCNGLYGSSEQTPLQLVYHAVGFEELSALYQLADICLVTSIRDGMNLVSHEYIASQKDRHGVLILSEFAGAAQSLNGASLINPWNIEALSQKIYDSLRMSNEEKEENYKSLCSYVIAHSAAQWGQSFLELLLDSSKAESKVTKSAGASGEHLIKPGALKIIEVRKAPKTSNFVFLEEPSVTTLLAIFDDKGMDDIQKLIPSNVSALSLTEHSLKIAGATKVLNLAVTSKRYAWQDVAHPIMSVFSDRTPGSKITADSNSMEWSFLFGDYEFWAFQAEELKSILSSSLASFSLEITLEPKNLKIFSYGEQDDVTDMIDQTKMLIPSIEVVECFTSDDHFETIKRHLIKSF